MNQQKEAQADDWRPVDIVISADTIISLDESKVLEKPENEEHAFEMLRELCNRE